MSLVDRRIKAVCFAGLLNRLDCTQQIKQACRRQGNGSSLLDFAKPTDRSVGLLETLLLGDSQIKNSHLLPIA